MTEKSKPEPKMVDATFVEDTTYAGVDIKAGKSHPVTEHWAKILKAQGKIK